MPKQNSKPGREQHEDDPNFRDASSAYDEKRATVASGHDDQGGSRQSEGRDYENRREARGQGGTTAGSENPDTRGSHSDARYARERYGEQTPADRRESMRQEQDPQNVGGQHGLDQSETEKHSLLGRASETGSAREEEVARQQRRSAGAANDDSGTDRAGEAYVSETRDNLSRQYAEHRRRENARRGAAGGGDYDGNWTRDTDKPPQPGPAAAESERPGR